MQPEVGDDGTANMVFAWLAPVRPTATEAKRTAQAGHAGRSQPRGNARYLFVLKDVDGGRA